MTIDQQEANATQPDAPAEDKTVEQPLSSRELAIEAIAEARAKQINEELGIVTEPEPVIEAPAPAPKEEDEQLAAQLTSIDDPRGKTVRVKVDGEEMDIPLEEVLRNYQKGSAADRRLEEATRLLKEAKAQAYTEPQQEHAGTQPEAGPDELLKMAVKTAMAKLLEGDDDAAASELVKVMTRGHPSAAPEMPQIDLNQIADQLQQRMDVKSAIEKVRTDYPDIEADPDLDHLTYLKVKAKEAAGIPTSQALIEAAGEVYKVLGKKPGRQAEPSESAQRDQKLARKAAIDTVPVAHAAASMPQTETSSPSAIIAEMAAQRLGQTMRMR